MSRYTDEYLNAFQSFYHGWLIPAFEQLSTKYSGSYTILYDEEVYGIKTAAGNLYVTRLKVVNTGINSIRIVFAGNRNAKEVAVRLYAFNRGNLKETRLNLFRGTFDELKDARFEALIMDEVKKRLDSVPVDKSEVREEVLINGSPAK
jgi:hypothetical protein